MMGAHGGDSSPHGLTQIQETRPLSHGVHRVPHFRGPQEKDPFPACAIELSQWDQISSSKEMLKTETQLETQMPCTPARTNCPVKARACAEVGATCLHE